MCAQVTHKPFAASVYKIILCLSYYNVYEQKKQFPVILAFSVTLFLIPGPRNCVNIKYFFLGSPQTKKKIKWKSLKQTHMCVVMFVPRTPILVIAHITIQTLTFVVV